LRIAVLAARAGWHTAELQRAATERGHEATILPYEGLVASIGSRPGLRSRTTELDAVDTVLARIIPSGSLEQIIFRVDALHRLEDRGVPTPPTIVCDTAEEAAAAFRMLGDVIVKPLFGSMGLGMVRVDNEEMAYRVFRTIEQIRGVYYLQRTIEHDGVDVRAFVVGGRVLGAIERRAAGWRTNLARGGAARSITLPDHLSGLAVRAAAAVGADYAGVDLLTATDGTVYVLEVNGIPGWRGLQEATGIDVAGTLMDFLTIPSR
jgi:glutathione synthase/RimK-type ligase-like ATP-grasp enzyme